MVLLLVHDKSKLGGPASKNRHRVSAERRMQVVESFAHLRRGKVPPGGGARICKANCVWGEGVEKREGCSLQRLMVVS